MLNTITSEGEESQRILFVLFPQVNILDLAGPLQVFHAAIEHGAHYHLMFCAFSPELPSAQGLCFAQIEPFPRVRAGDWVLVPGWHLHEQEPILPLFDQQVIDWLQGAVAAGAQVASICTAAFLLGAAGLLDHRRCTTHWAAIAHLQRAFPLARVQDNVLFVHEPPISTSAGVASGIDLALWFVERDYGPVFTAQLARYLVLYLRRDGSHPQSSVYLDYRSHLYSGIHRAQDFLIASPSRSVSLQELAEVAGMRLRSFVRTFKVATGLTPVQYHQRLRLELAAQLLHNPDLSIEAVAHRCGFADARHFRRLWRQQFGSPPSSHRREIS